MVTGTRKRVYRKKTTTGKRLNRRQKKEVITLISKRLETKNKIGYDTDNVSSAGSIFNISNITQGTSGSQHVGDEITFKSVDLRFTCEAYDEYNHIRVIVFRWMEDAFAGLPTAADILSTASVGSGYEYLAPYNQTGRNKFKICYDRTFNVGTTKSFNSTGAIASYYSSGVGQTKTSHIQIYGKKLGLKHMEEVSGGLGVGNIFILAISDSTSIGSHPRYWFVSNVRYIDA